MVAFNTDYLVGLGTLVDRMLILVEAAGALQPRCMTRQKICRKW